MKWLYNLLCATAPILFLVANAFAQGVSPILFEDRLAVQTRVGYGNPARFEILDLRGSSKLMYKKDAVYMDEKVVLELDSMLPGVYIVSLVSTGTWMKKIISQGFSSRVTVELDLQVDIPCPDGLLVYPNPAFGPEATIEWCMEPSVADIRVFDLQGRTMLAFRAEREGGLLRKKLDLSQLPAGAYIVQVSNGVETVKKRLVKAMP